MSFLGKSYSDIFLIIVILRVEDVFPLVNSLYREKQSETAHECRSNSKKKQGFWCRIINEYWCLK